MDPAVSGEAGNVQLKIFEHDLPFPEPDAQLLVIHMLQKLRRARRK
jgi:hypothetical protein